MTSMLNTLRYARALKNAGVGAQQAEAMADALEAEMVGELASKADIERLETQIGHLDEKLSGRIDGLDEKFTGRIDSLDKRIDGLKTTIGVSVALATLVLTAVQVYFGVR